MGIRQAQILAEIWESTGVEFDLVISSPFARARHTAEIITQQLGVALGLDAVWMERDSGVVEGMHLDEANHLYPYPDFLSPFTPILPVANRSGISTYGLVRV